MPSEDSKNPQKGSRRKLTPDEILHFLDEFLYYGELRDFVQARASFHRISSSLGTEEIESLIPPCLEVLDFSNAYIRSDTFLCLVWKISTQKSSLQKFKQKSKQSK